jgi:hypothetical protein
MANSDKQDRIDSIPLVIRNAMMPDPMIDDAARLMSVLFEQVSAVDQALITAYDYSDDRRHALSPLIRSWLMQLQLLKDQIER